MGLTSYVGRPRHRAPPTESKADGDCALWLAHADNQPAPPFNFWVTFSNACFGILSLLKTTCTEDTHLVHDRPVVTGCLRRKKPNGHIANRFGHKGSVGVVGASKPILPAALNRVRPDA